MSLNLRYISVSTHDYLIMFSISLLVLVIIIVLLALISGQEPIPVGQEADARQRR